MVRLLSIVWLTFLMACSSSMENTKKTEPTNKKNSSPYQHYGFPFSMTNPTTLDQAVKLASQSKAGKEVFFKAKVDKVCRKKGCWLTLKSPSSLPGKKDLRVTFKDYSFFVPVTLMGKMVKVQGTLIEKKMTLDETKHFAEDAGLDSGHITRPASEYRVIASGVAIL